jgi:hypothetical protein
MKNVVYMIEDAFGRVKIGTTQDLRSRLRAIRTATGRDHILIRKLPGGRAVEKWLHDRFAAQRTVGEWFQYTSEMLDVIPPNDGPPEQADWSMFVGC